MNNVFNCLFLCFLVVLLGACSNDDLHLTRVDVQLVADDNSLEEEQMILDLITLDSINSLLHEVQWEPKGKQEVAGSEDLIATIFYTKENERQDQLYLYRIWYNHDDSLTIISNNNEEVYGTLDEEYADKLKNLLESYL